MFLKKYKSTVEKLVEPPLPEKPVRKTKEKKDSPKKSKVKNDSNIFFEMNKTKDNNTTEKPIKDDKKPSKQPEHLRKALEARRARIAEEKAQGIKPKPKQKKKSKEDSDSDSSLSSLDMNKIILKEKKKENKKEVPKKYFSDSDSS
jgi:hypothetical protein